jgi:hypothetical protein
MIARLLIASLLLACGCAKSPAEAKLHTTDMPHAPGKQPASAPTFYGSSLRQVIEAGERRTLMGPEFRRSIPEESFQFVRAHAEEALAILRGKIDAPDAIVAANACEYVHALATVPAVREPALKLLLEGFADSRKLVQTAAGAGLIDLGRKAKEERDARREGETKD